MTLTIFSQGQLRSHIAESCLNVTEGENFRKWTNGQNNYDFEKEIDPRGYFDPALGLYTYMYMNIIVKQIYWYIRSQISGERLQDHWASGFYCFGQNCRFECSLCYQINHMHVNMYTLNYKS